MGWSPEDRNFGQNVALFCPKNFVSSPPFFLAEHLKTDKLLLRGILIDYWLVD